MKRADYCGAEYCCKEMSDFIDDYRIPIDFDPDKNRYFIPLMWPNNNITQGLRYCPWCGKKLSDISQRDRKLITNNP